MVPQISELFQVGRQSGVCKVMLATRTFTPLCGPRSPHPHSAWPTTLQRTCEDRNEHEVTVGLSGQAEGGGLENLTTPSRPHPDLPFDARPQTELYKNKHSKVDASCHGEQTQKHQEQANERQVKDKLESRARQTRPWRQYVVYRGYSRPTLLPRRSIGLYRGLGH